MTGNDYNPPEPTAAGISGRRLGWALILAALAAASQPVVGQSRWIKLSDGMPFSDVNFVEISADGEHVVYLHDAQTDDTLELWSVPVTGGTPVRLNGALSAGASASPFAITPDGTRVVYAAPQDSAAIELYSVPIAGGSAVKLNSALVPGGNFGAFEISPDGSRVVYRADQDTDEVVELYSVPISGGAVAKISGSLVTGGDVSVFETAADSSRVVYLADRDTDGVAELYSTPISGGAGPVKLNGMVGPGADVQSFCISPDGSRVVYLAAGGRQLDSVPIAGAAAPDRLNDTPVPGGAVVNFQISPDSSRVVYQADQQTNDVFELYSTAIAGGGAAKLNGLLTAGGDTGDYRISPDGTRVVYIADQETDEVFEIYSVLITSGGPFKLNGTLASGGDVYSFRISPDSSWVVYDADQAVATQRLGHRVPLAGPSGSDEPLWSDALWGHLGAYLIDTSSRRVLIHSNDSFSDTVLRLWEAPLTGVNPAANTRELIPLADLAPDGDVIRFAIGPRGSIVYVADQDANEVLELYGIPDRLFADGFE